MATRVGDIFVNLKLDRSEYDKGLKGLEATASKFGSSIGRKLSLGLAVAGLAKFAKQCTEAGASLNAMGTIIDASLPHMTAQVDAFAKSAGSAFGLSETQAKGFVGKFASMAHAMGYTEKQAYAMSTTLAGLAGDVASYYHISQDEAFTKLNAVFTGETESLKQLGIVMTQNALDAFAMEQGLGKTVNQMSELEKTSLRYQFILSSLSLAQGDFAKYSDTWSGSLATIRLNWQNFMATVGQGLINILLPLMQFIAKLSNVLTWLGQKFLWLTRLITGKDAEVGASLDSTFGNDTQTMFNDAGASIGNIGTGMKGLGGNAKKAKKDVQALKREMMGFDRITKLTGKADSATGTTGAGGVGGGGGGVGDIGDLEALDDLIDNLAIPDTTTASWEGWKKVVADALDLLLSAGKMAIDDVLAPLLGLVTKHIAPLAIDAIGTALKNIVDLATSFPKWLMDLFSNGDKTVTIDVDDKFSETWEQLKNLSDLGVSVKLYKGFSEATVSDWLLNNGYIGQVTAHVGLERGFTGTVADWLKNNNYIGTLAVGVGLVKAFTNGVSTVADWLIKTSSVGSGIAVSVGLVKAFANGASTVADWLTKSKLIGGVINFGIGLATDFGKGIGNVAKWIKDKHFGGNVNKNIGLTANFGKGISTVKAWVEKKHWGKGIFKKVGLTRAFTYAGRTFKTVTSWVLAQLGGGSVDVKANVDGTGRKAKGGVYKNGRWSPIERYASGGLPNGSQLFWAREAGPELVGTLGGHTAVMNNDQIVASVSAGVARAIAGIHFKMQAPRLASTSAIRSSSMTTNQNSSDAQMVVLLTQILKAINAQENNVYLDGEQIKNNVVRRINNHTRATGQLELII